MINTLWKHVANEGMLVVIESGTPTGFSIIKNLRDLILSNKNNGANGILLNLLNSFHILIPFIFS